MLYLAESKKVVVVGIPGVGKTTLINKIVELIKGHNKSVKVTNFGTIMFDVAKENGLQTRDELRRLPLSEQKKLQKIAAEKLSKINDNVVIIDTHAFIRTPEGFNPGLPYHVLQIIEPSNFISVYAKTEEIYNRRMKDDTRTRDKVSIATIKKVDEAADQIIKAIGL